MPWLQLQQTRCVSLQQCHAPHDSLLSQLGCCCYSCAICCCLLIRCFGMDPLQPPMSALYCSLHCHWQSHLGATVCQSQCTLQTPLVEGTAVSCHTAWAPSPSTCCLHRCRIWAGSPAAACRVQLRTRHGWVGASPASIQPAAAQPTVDFCARRATCTAVLLH
jgi:hypothetical protein